MLMYAESHTSNVRTFNLNKILEEIGVLDLAAGIWFDVHCDAPTHQVRPRATHKWWE